MERYRTFETLINALEAGKKITFYSNNTISAKEIHGRLVRPIYFWCNPQMNRIFVMGDNNREYEDELPITIIDIIYQLLDGFTDYDEKINEIEKNKVVEMTKEQVEEKLGYKIRIV